MIYGKRLSLTNPNLGRLNHSETTNPKDRIIMFANHNKKTKMELDILRSRIHSVRDQKVMLDFDLAELYEVETRVLNQAVKRNSERFPEDFMFQLDTDEWSDLKSQSVMSSWGGRRTPPYVFTEQGVSMLSSVLSSAKAIRVNIAIMRAFVLMRQFALSHTELTNQLKELEQRYDRQFNDIFEAIGYLMEGEKRAEELKARKQIGFKRTAED